MRHIDIGTEPVTHGPEGPKAKARKARRQRDEANIEISVRNAQ